MTAKRKLDDAVPHDQSHLTFGAVAIGRNEGERLKRCLESLSAAARVVYVDSGSSDGSMKWARQQSADVVELDMKAPFTAARARNAGFRRLCALLPGVPYVQFVDGDCELNRAWSSRAVEYLNSNSSVAAVCGRRRELFPQNSVYNWLCELEWNVPPGETRAFGGDVMIRATALDAVGGYRDDLIAGEDPELSVRLRAAGWRILRLDADMTVHDANMKYFSQWWRRAVRAGYAFAQGANLHGNSPERHYVWESRRAWLWGLLLPLICLAAGLAFSSWGWAAWLIFPLQIIRQIARNSGSLGDRFTLAIYQVLARFPEVWGELKFLRDRLLGCQTRLIEYK